MARKPRSHAEGNIYNIGNRGARRLVVFGDDDDRRSFLGLLGTAAERFGATILAFCLLTNHYHLLARAPRENIDRVMQYAASIYVQRFNRKYKLDGPLFRGRYWAEPVRDDAELLSVARYIERNALDIEPDTPLGQYRWSSLGSIIGTRPILSMLDAAFVLGVHGGSPEEYLEFVSKEPEHDGDRPPSPTPALRLERPQDEIEHVVEVVASGLDPAVLRGDATRTRIQLTVLLTAEFGALSAAETAVRYGYANATTVHATTTAARKKIRNDPVFASLATSARTLLSVP